MRHVLQVWDGAFTARQAIATAVLDLRRRRVLQGEETLDVVLPAIDPAADAAVTGAVLQLHEVPSDEVSLWRVSRPRRLQDAADAHLVEIQARALWMDFIEGIVYQAAGLDIPLIYDFGIEATVPELLALIVAGYEGTGAGGNWISFELGDVDPEFEDQLVSLEFARTNPLAALRMLEQEAGCEARFRLSGTTYYIDLVAHIGSAEPTAELRYQKNLLGLERTEDDTDIVTRVRAWGDGELTLGDARWRLQEVPGQPGRWAIAGDVNPIVEDGAFVNWGFRVPGKATYPITASSRAGQYLELNIGARPALADGETGYFTIAGERPAEHIDIPSGIASYGIRLPAPETATFDVPDANNLVANPTLSEWIEDLDLLASWLPIPSEMLLYPEISDERDPLYARHGGGAARVVCTIAGQGISSVPVPIPTDERRPYMGFRVGLTIESGHVKVALRHSSGDVYPFGQEAVSAGTDGWVEISGLAADEPLPPGELALEITAVGGPAEYVVDHAMLTLQTGSSVPAFIAGNGAHALWKRALELLREHSRPAVEYAVDIADLYRVDPEAFRFERLDLGDVVVIVPPHGPSPEAARVIEVEQDLIESQTTEVVLADSVNHRLPDPYRPGRPGGRPRVRWTDVIGAPIIRPPDPVDLYFLSAREVESTDTHVTLEAERGPGITLIAYWTWVQEWPLTTEPDPPVTDPDGLLGSSLRLTVAYPGVRQRRYVRLTGYDVTGKPRTTIDLPIDPDTVPPDRIVSATAEVDHVTGLVTHTVPVGDKTGSIRTVDAASGSILPPVEAGTIRTPVDGVVTWTDGPLPKDSTRTYMAVPYTGSGAGRLGVLDHGERVVWHATRRLVDPRVSLALDFDPEDDEAVVTVSPGEDVALEAVAVYGKIYRGLVPLPEWQGGTPSPTDHHFTAPGTAPARVNTGRFFPRTGHLLLRYVTARAVAVAADGTYGKPIDVSAVRSLEPETPPTPVDPYNITASIEDDGDSASTCTAFFRRQFAWGYDIDCNAVWTWAVTMIVGRDEYEIATGTGPADDSGVQVSDYHEALGGYGNAALRVRLWDGDDLIADQYEEAAVAVFLNRCGDPVPE